MHEFLGTSQKLQIKKEKLWFFKEWELEIWANILGVIINYCNCSDHSVIIEAQFKIRISHVYFGWCSIGEISSMPEIL